MELIDFKNKTNVLVRIAPHKGIKSEYILLQNVRNGYYGYEGRLNLYLYYFDGQCRSISLPADHKLTVTRAKAALALKAEYDTFLLLEQWRDKLYHNDVIQSTGSDPEIFAETKDGELVPAFHFLGGKDKPHIAPAVNYGRNHCYWDGYQAEFNTTAIGCHGWHLDSIQNGLRGVYEALKKLDKTAKLSVKTTFDIPKENLRSDADEHVNFGCMPSKNAYGMEGLKDNGRNVSYRSAGGHIHFGLHAAMKNEKKIIMGVKGMDAILGVACVSLFAKYDDARRRQMYGLAGEYRTPAHGVEYRVLSNAWLCHPFITNLVLDIGRKAYTAGVKDLLKDWKCSEKETIRIINECDVDAARKVLEENNLFFKIVIASAYPGASVENFNSLFNVFMSGIDAVVSNPQDIEGNWCLNKTWTAHSGGAMKNVSSSFATLKSKKKVS